MTPYLANSDQGTARTSDWSMHTPHTLSSTRSARQTAGQTACVRRGARTLAIGGERAAEQTSCPSSL